MEQRIEVDKLIKIRDQLKKKNKALRQQLKYLQQRIREAYELRQRKM